MANNQSKLPDSDLLIELEERLRVLQKSLQQAADGAGAAAESVRRVIDAVVVRTKNGKA